MAIDIRRDSIMIEKDGTISLSVHFFETDNGTVLQTASVQGKTAADIEEKLRPKIEAAKAKYAGTKQLEAAADARIDALRVEMGLTAATIKE